MPRQHPSHIFNHMFNLLTWDLSKGEIQEYIAWGDEIHLEQSRLSQCGVHNGCVTRFPVIPVTENRESKFEGFSSKQLRFPKGGPHSGVPLFQLSLSSLINQSLQKDPDRPIIYTTHTHTQQDPPIRTVRKLGPTPPPHDQIICGGWSWGGEEETKKERKKGLRKGKKTNSHPGTVVVDVVGEIGGDIAAGRVLKAVVSSSSSQNTHLFFFVVRASTIHVFCCYYCSCCCFHIWPLQGLEIQVGEESPHS